MGLLFFLAGSLACGGGGGGGGDDDASAGHDAGRDAADVPDDAGQDAAPGPTELVHFIGRFDDDGDTKRFAWPGTSIATRFDGTDLTIRLDDGGANLFEVTIDGEAQPVLETTAGEADYAIATGLAAGPHDVVVARRTESFFGATRFVSFSGATLVETPVPDRFVEIIGDSITCGYGVLGVGPYCDFSADTEAETHAWGSFAAAELGAAHASIAYSGRGAWRNNDGGTDQTMRELYLRTIADDAGSAWDFAGYSPDVVVVALGTNDFAQGDPGADFVTGLLELVDGIRAHFPDPWILLAESPMLSDSYPPGEMHRSRARAHLEAAVTAAADSGDDRVVLLEIAEQQAADGLGCDYHPNETTERKMADALVARVRALTGW